MLCMMKKMSRMKRMRKAMMGTMMAAMCAVPAAAVAAPSARGPVHAPASTEDAVRQDIVATALAAGSFKTLAAALQAAGLVDTLKGQGPYTVFAPTDDAFAKLPAGTLEDLLKPENKARLTAILTYHVVPGSVDAKTAASLASAKTVNGQTLSLSTENGQVRVDGATVTSADIVCANGVIHVIDQVVLPK